MRLAPLLALPPITLGIAAAVWMIASAPGPAQIDGRAPALPVRVMTVAAEDIRPTATAWGNLRTADTWVAVAEVQGEVIWRHPDLEPGRLIPEGTEVLEGSRTAPGVSFTARTVLRFGVALLGVRISVETLSELGPRLIALTVAGVVATILCGLLLARFAGRDWRFGLLTGGSVAICGASAAMAISAILPKHDKAEGDLVFTVLAVTVLSTVAMVLYPMISHTLGFSALESGVFLGGTIHDVAQVVGAGFSISQEAGETSTLVKLIRVSMLAPVVLIASLVIRASGTARDGSRPPLLPGFVVGFVVLAVLNSVGLIPNALAQYASSVSRWALLVSIAAVGIKTSLARTLEIGPLPIGLLVVETLFIGSFILSGLQMLE